MLEGGQEELGTVGEHVHNLPAVQGFIHSTAFTVASASLTGFEKIEHFFD